jgi:hypothetical protein
MKRAMLLLAAIVLFSLSSYGTSNAHHRHPSRWLHHYYGYRPYLPSLRGELASRREETKADAAGVLYARGFCPRWCAYIDWYW